MTNWRHVFLGIVCVSMLVAAGCGGGQESSQPTPVSATEVSTADSTGAAEISPVPSFTNVPSGTEIVLLTLSIPTIGPGAAQANSSPFATLTGPPSPSVVDLPPTSTAIPDPNPTSVGCAVANTGGDGAFIRSAPQSGDKIKAWPDESTMLIVGPDELVAEVTWKKVSDPDGNIGYVASQYLVCGEAGDESESAPVAATIAATPSPDPDAVVCLVGDTNGDGVYIRRTPGEDDWIKLWDDDTPMVVVGTNVLSDSRRWKHVRDPDGNVGYVAADFLVCPE